MKSKKRAFPKQQRNKIIFFIAGMILSAIITNIIDRFFPPEPVVVHTVIDSVKIVHQFNRNNKYVHKKLNPEKSNDTIQVQHP